VHDLPLLQDAQQARLERHRHLGNFIEEERPAVGKFQESLLSTPTRTGESALVIAEELAFQQRFLKRRTVDRDKRLVGPLACAVDAAGEEFLPRSRLSENQDRCVTGGVAPRLFLRPLHRRAAAVDVVQIRLDVESLAEEFAADLRFRLLDRCDILERDDGAGERPVGEDRDVVCQDAAVAHGQNLVEFRLTQMHEPGKTRMGEEPADGSPDRLFPGDSRDLLGRRVENRDQPLPVGCDDAAVSEIQDRLELLGPVRLLAAEKPDLHGLVERALDTVGRVDEDRVHASPLRRLENEAGADDGADVLVEEFVHHLLHLREPVRIIHNGLDPHRQHIEGVFEVLDLFAVCKDRHAVGKFPRSLEGMEDVEAGDADFDEGLLQNTGKKPGVAAAGDEDVRFARRFDPLRNRDGLFQNGIDDADRDIGGRRVPKVLDDRRQHRRAHDGDADHCPAPGAEVGCYVTRFYGADNLIETAVCGAGRATRRWRPAAPGPSPPMPVP